MKPEHIVMGLTALVSLVTLVKMIRGSGNTEGAEETQIKALVEGFELLRTDIKNLSHVRLLPLEKDVAVLKEQHRAHDERLQAHDERLRALEAHTGRRG